MADFDHGAADVIMALSSPPPPAQVVLIRLDGAGAIPFFEEYLGLHSEDNYSDQISLSVRQPTFVELPWAIDFPQVPAVAITWEHGASWTGNETVEIILPGSQPLVEGLLAMLERAGARMATPGEFTRRAFMNRRIDLSRAESVLAVIEAEDRAALAAARRVLDGELAHHICNLNDQLVDVLARLEAGLDFSEQEVESPGAEELQGMLTPIQLQLESLLERRCWPSQGPDIPRVLLWGKPNAGKSTLLNALVGAPLAITSPTAGTTTDVIRGRIEQDGQSIELLDLPGDREAEGEIERIALMRARELLDGDDRIMWVFDGRRGDEEWHADKSGLPPDVASRAIPVWTHLDSPDAISPASADVNHVSAIANEGLDDLRDKLVHQVRQIPGQIRGDALRFTRRQKHLLERCRDSLNRSMEAAVAGPELLVADLREAAHWLSEISGETTPEEVLDRIFSRFCLGK